MVNAGSGIASLLIFVPFVDARIPEERKKFQSRKDGHVDVVPRLEVDFSDSERLRHKAPFSRHDLGGVMG